MYRTGPLVLTLEANFDNDTIQSSCPSCDCHLPMQYHNGDYLPNDSARAPSHPQLPTSNTTRVDYQDSNSNNSNNNSILDNAANVANNTCIISNDEVNTTNSNMNGTNASLDINPSDTPYTLNNITNTTEDNYSIPVHFSTSNKTHKADKDIESICRYLLSQRAPPELSGDVLTRFVSRMCRFLIASGRLWQRQSDGQHQLYARPPQQYVLVRNVHDNLGHKGFYSTRRALLNQFWWPSLESDVKWYVQTCHQCQIRQTMCICLLPTVNTPAPLFQKAYIDTMFMPLAGRYRYITQARCSLTAWPEWRALHVETG